MAKIHVDVETTSTHTWNGVVLSIGAVEQESRETFHVCINSVDDRTLPWDKDTYDWWHSEELKAAHDRLESMQIVEVKTAMQWFRDFCLKFGPGPHTFCAWPASFDHPYVDELFGLTEIQSPFHYRTLDVKSYLCGKLGIDVLAGRTAFPSWTELKPEFEHDALSDAIAQMEVYKSAESDM